MTKYREILRLSSLGFSNRNIALSGPCSRNTVAKVLKRAQELDISSAWITAALRNEQFFSLAELNRAIREKLEQFNRKLFQKKEGSRLDLFLEDEKPLLSPLPATRFELSDWKIATVQFNYHISVDGMLIKYDKSEYNR
ncbi:MAG: hypothetical protein ACI4J9_08330 [Mogibacterium kristiansenii]|uniref:hypothetical protein n=1 Tax=Mogibacterium kristiansenii TaxID=2606708 RepID=UPI003F08A032